MLDIKIIIDKYIDDLKSFLRAKSLESSDIAVSLLLDNSGSLRGQMIEKTASSVNCMARVLEEVGIKFEVTDFTTVAWKGGASREEWLASGRPRNTGRLSDIRLISYKDFETPLSEADGNFALMLSEGILKENIDGEALYFVHEQLIKRPEEYKVLMVLSDGAPVDDSTLSLNPAICLEDHLRLVIRNILDVNKVYLSSVGIQHDVSGQYTEFRVVDDLDQILDAAFGQLMSDIERIK